MLTKYKRNGSLLCSLLCPILWLLLPTSCASKGFNRGDLKDQIAVTKPEFTSSEISDAFNKKPNLPKAFKLAVYFKSPSLPSNSSHKLSSVDWRWTEQDKEILETIAAELKKDGVVSDVFPIMSSLVADEDLKSLRLAAAKHQADALLVISGAGQTDRYINNLGWTYALILPALFIPGSEADTLFVTNAALWDVRNEFLYLTAEAEATTNKSYIAAFGKQDKELINEAKTSSLIQLKSELYKMIKGSRN
jgi:hypothetical protein